MADTNNKRRITIACAALLLTMFATQAVLSMRCKSVTVDELMYIAAGYYHIETGDFAMNMTNPPLMKMVAAVPLRFLDPKPVLPPIDGEPRQWSVSQQWQYSRAFLYNNITDADWMLFISRLPIVAIGVLLGAYVFRWSYVLYGSSGALLATFCYAMSPNILAHTRLATHDLGLTAFMFMASYHFWSFLRRPRLAAILLTGVFAGLSALTKTTSVFLAPIFLAVVLLHVWRRDGQGVCVSFPWVSRLPEVRVRSRQLLSGAWAAVIVMAVALFVLNAGYAFQGFPAFFGEKGAFGVLAGIPMPIPGPFAEMIAFQSRLTASSGGVYFAGHLYDTGLWYLMIVSVLLKTPLAGVLLIVAAVAGLVRRFASSPDEWLLAIFVAVVLFVFSYLANINMGLRYVLPIFPFLHVLVGRLFRKTADRSRVVTGLVLVMIGWYGFSSLRVYPDYLAHFNEIIGGPVNGYKYLVDSNLDWGQDLKALKSYMDEHDIDRIKLGYFGSADAEYYGIDYDYLPSVGLATTHGWPVWWYEETAACENPMEAPKGVVAVSATLRASPGWMTHVFGNCYSWTKDYEPVDQIGHSILIYRID